MKSWFYIQFKNFQLNLNFECCMCNSSISIIRIVYREIHPTNHCKLKQIALHSIENWIEMILKSNVKIPNWKSNFDKLECPAGIWSSCSSFYTAADNTTASTQTESKWNISLAWTLSLTIEMKYWHVKSWIWLIVSLVTTCT